jgi:hypothetical protein
MISFSLTNSAETRTAVLGGGAAVDSRIAPVSS